ncbi:hypothetical protein JCM19240_5958 [Vibrio maritimus]|uniref:Uncharacterized protein n=1 Tax=Vibrio maritimus TaxID=990268 RepID=A0A090SXY9_9VIBR|nr:hypothetical protein JCM19240_5958 [Vibrio maritimus]
MFCVLVFNVSMLETFLRAFANKSVVLAKTRFAHHYPRGTQYGQ